MNLEEIGEKAFTFALIFSLVSTIIVLTLLAGGYPPEQLRAPLFLAATTLYKNVKSLAGELPKNATLEEVKWTMAASFVSGFGQFIMSFLFGFLGLVQTIASIIPSEVGFLTIPLYFIGSFLQVMVWYYFLTRVLDTLRSWLPF